MKKQRTFTQRWNATALRRILKQLKKHEESHLCTNSSEFKELWQAHQLDIKALASKYVFKHCRVKEETSPCLFYSNGDLDFCDWIKIRKQVRIDFLTNEIKRLTKKKP